MRKEKRVKAKVKKRGIPMDPHWITSFPFFGIAHGIHGYPAPRVIGHHAVQAAGWYFYLFNFVNFPPFREMSAISLFTSKTKATIGSLILFVSRTPPAPRFITAMFPSSPAFNFFLSVLNYTPPPPPASLLVRIISSVNGGGS
jgi:hypothetical protein